MKFDSKCKISMKINKDTGFYSCGPNGYEVDDINENGSFVSLSCLSSFNNISAQFIIGGDSSANGFKFIPKRVTVIEMNGQPYKKLQKATDVKKNTTKKNTTKKSNTKRQKRYHK